MKTDLILMHPPSVYDFREKTIMFGPMSDMVPSTPVFEMYPIGFLTISNYLEKRGFNVRIINLAYRMIENPKFNVEKFIKKLNPVAFGIDLHWLPHCQGALEVAKILKRLHPQTPVIFGGISATYYHEELIEFPQVDYIVKGDSTEEPLNQLMQTIKENRLENLKNIPNLSWKQNGAISSNPITNISSDLEEIDFDYRIMFKNVLRYRDIKSITPFSDWFRYPATTVRLARGCLKICSYCGGSKYASRLFDNRDKPAFRSPKKLVNEIALIQKYINAPVILLGDINHNGQEYVKEFFDHAKKLDPNMQILFEFFVPPSEWFFDEACKVFKNVCYEMSADSHSVDVRKKMGKSYSNEELVDRIVYGLKKGAVRFDLYFMTGMPGQDKESILDTVNFCKDIYERLNWDKRFSPFISPMAPFLDPGSRAFENPESLGYTLTRKTLKDHIEAITQPSWKYILNYESHAVTRDDLVSSTYESALGLNKLKGKAGTISSRVMEENEKRTFRAIEMMKEIDSIMEIENLNIRQEKFEGLKNRLSGLSMSTVCEKKELEFPMFSKTFNWFQIIKATLSPL